MRPVFSTKTSHVLALPPCAPPAARGGWGLQLNVFLAQPAVGALDFRSGVCPPPAPALGSG